jgi:hypothetical protein
LTAGTIAIAKNNASPSSLNNDWARQAIDARTNVASPTTTTFQSDCHTHLFNHAGGLAD